MVTLHDVIVVLPLLILAYVMLIVNLGVVESKMAAYYGPVPEPDPGQLHNKYHWVASAMQKIRNECPMPTAKPTASCSIDSDEPLGMENGDIPDGSITASSEYSSLPATKARLNHVDGICGHRLGMEDGSIPDSRITASSTYDRCQTSYGRLNYNVGTEYSAWCTAYNDKQAPWFQVDLATQMQVEGVIMQGSYHTFFNEWVTAYQVQYSDDQTSWQYVTLTSSLTAQTFIGNTDETTPVTSIFDQPIRARYIRIRPTAYHDWPSMRIELIGCKGNPPGWCAGSDDSNPWIQVDLSAKVYITGLITQRYVSKLFIKNYTVEYSDDGESWNQLTDADGISKQFIGNSGGDDVTTIFEEALYAKFVRILPTSWNYQTDSGNCCMRFEVLGCK